MPGPQPPSRQSSVSSNNTAVDAALVGAATAFGRPGPAQRAPSNARIARGTQGGGDNGALAAAAATAGKDRRAPSRSPLPPPLRSSAGSVSSVQPLDTSADRSTSRRAQPGVGRSQYAQEDIGRSHTLDLDLKPTLVPQHTGPYSNKLASQQAAVLAASRARPSPPARPAVAPKPRRFSGQRKIDDTSDKPTDTTPIPPTTSLVDLFEQKSRAEPGAIADRPSPIVLRPEDRPVKSPKPIRSGITSMFQLELEENSKSADRQQSRDSGQFENSLPKHGDGNSSEDSFASASEDLNAESPGDIVVGNTRPQSQSPGSAGSALKMQNEAKRRPFSVSPLRNTVSKPMQIRRPSAPSRDALPTSSSLSAKSIHAQYNQAYPRPGRMTPLTTGDQLANALVASSLASSRAPSPTRLEPPPVPTRRRKNTHHHHNVLGFSRTPSPAKAGMLHTLRPQNSSSESESDAELHPYGKHKKKRLVRKHPNKHHEGDRKRWRDAVTERERKRYEGVWAANKGIHSSFTLQEEQLFSQAPNSERTREIRAAANDQVSNVVVRDIWNRSRLPETTLETVWDLVDHDLVGRLSREEFVVGMWLIDQRLKGRKLPVKVTESVWASVRSLQGIKIRK